MEREEITILSKASPISRSLRSTVPMSLIKLLKLKEGDKLKWGIQAKDNSIVIFIEPIRIPTGKKENFSSTIREEY